MRVAIDQLSSVFGRLFFYSVPISSLPEVVYTSIFTFQYNIYIKKTQNLRLFPGDYCGRPVRLHCDPFVRVDYRGAASHHRCGCASPISREWRRPRGCRRRRVPGQRRSRSRIIHQIPFCPQWQCVRCTLACLCVFVCVCENDVIILFSPTPATHL